jgi:hypothetical protein
VSRQSGSAVSSTRRRSPCRAGPTAVT